MRLKLSLFFLVLFLSVSMVSRTEAAVDVNVNLFSSQLSPYGTWVNVPSVGAVWHPDGVPAGWRPYTVGQWVWTNDGWTWVSNEPWGATYHYGRWFYDPNVGWLWAPGSVWAPAWVSWYEGPDYVGWVPLAPVASFQIAPRFGIFVPTGSFLVSNIAPVVVAPAENITIIRNIIHINNIRIVRGRFFDEGPGLARIERATGERIKPVTVVSRNLNEHQIKSLGRHVDELRGNRLLTFRPSIRSSDRHHTALVRSASDRHANHLSRTAHVSPGERRTMTRQNGSSSLRHASRGLESHPTVSHQRADFSRKGPQSSALRPQKMDLRSSGGHAHSLAQGAPVPHERAARQNESPPSASHREQKSSGGEKRK